MLEVVKVSPFNNDTPDHYFFPLFKRSKQIFFRNTFKISMNCCINPFLKSQNLLLRKSLLSPNINQKSQYNSLVCNIFPCLEFYWTRQANIFQCTIWQVFFVHIALIAPNLWKIQQYISVSAPVHEKTYFGGNSLCHT